MHTVDCVLDGMSTFATDLSQVKLSRSLDIALGKLKLNFQMATALRSGTGNSLVLIDEFGKGTVMVLKF